MILCYHHFDFVKAERDYIECWVLLAPMIFYNRAATDDLEFGNWEKAVTFFLL
jgi:hypothetical protein